MRGQSSLLDPAAAMEFAPQGPIEVLTGDYRLLRDPDWVFGPSLGAAQVTWSPSPTNRS